MATATMSSAQHDYFALSPTRSSSSRLAVTPKRPARAARLGSQGGPSTPSGSVYTPGRALLSPARPTHRLLYRGALSLPDSHIVLDGLTFVANPLEHARPFVSTPGAAELMDNPLALALETMRGRSSVRLLGEVRLDSMHDVWLDESGDVSLYIHPSAFLTQTYITNILLSMPFDDDPSVPGSQRTSHGIKIALGDTSSPSSSKGAPTSSGTTEIVVFGRATGDASPNGTALRLVVARISLSPPALRTPDPQRRLPRPDDPTPRRPPLLYFGAKRPREVSGGSVFGDPAPSSKKAKSDPALLVVGKVPTEQDREAQRRARDVMLGLHRSSSVSSATSSRAGSVAPANSKPDRKASAGDPFKVPNLPSARKGKERGGSSAPLDVPSPSSEPNPYEEVNKLFVKRTVVLLLAKRGVHKHAHPEYADVYSHVYRGSAFALRNAMRTRLLDGPDDTSTVEGKVQAHMDLYLAVQD